MDQVRDFILAPALIAALPGLWACSRKQVILGVVLALVGVVLIGAMAFFLASVAVLAQVPIHLVVWPLLVLFCGIAIAIITLAGRGNGKLSTPASGR